ncbi:MAG: plastocyanin/azurin family copper-binding protein [Vicinamibacterales bacterium]
MKHRGGANMQGMLRRFVVLVVAASISACSSSNQAPAASSTPAPAAADAPAGPPVVVGKAPPGAIVTLEPVSRTLPAPDAPAVMDQYGKQFVPGELFVRVGQAVEFKNTEDQMHNVIVRRSGSGANVFHVSTDPSEKYVHTFDRPGRYDVSCDLHLGMAATIIATTSPYFAVADADGHFTIQNVEAGAYKITALVSGQNLEKTIEVSAGRTEVSLGR